MNSITHKIALDIHKSGPQLFMSMIRGDTKRTIVVSLMEKGKPYIITNGCVAMFTAVKPDGNFIYNDCWIDYENNTIVYDVTSQTTAVSGAVNCQIKLIGEDGGIITSPAFGIIISDTLYNEEEIIPSAEEFHAITANFADIYRKLDELSKRIRYDNVTLQSDKWVDDSARQYLQVVNIDGVTENSYVELTLTKEQIAIFDNKDIAFSIENEDGVITVCCTGQKPSADYTVQVMIMEVFKNG